MTTTYTGPYTQEELPPLEETHLPDIYVDIDIPLLALGDGIITDRHHASAANYEADDAMNQIGGQITSFAWGGWVRHGCEAFLQQLGATVCHPGAANGAYAREEVYERDLANGYHEQGSCADDSPCLLLDLFGGFNTNPGKVIRHPIGFSPIRREVDPLEGEVEAHYRQLNTHVRSRNDEDGGQPLRHATRDALANVTGTMKLTLRDVKPEFIGLILETVAYLDAHSDEYAHQLGGSRNFGGGMVDCQLLNPLYTDREITRVYNRAQTPTNAMDEKDDRWADEYRPAFRQALQKRLTADHDDITPLEAW